MALELVAATGANSFTQSIASAGHGLVAGDKLIAVHIGERNGATISSDEFTVVGSVVGSQAWETTTFTIGVRTVTSSEPTNYTFESSNFAEATLYIFKDNDYSSYDDESAYAEAFTTTGGLTVTGYTAAASTRIVSLVRGDSITSPGTPSGFSRLLDNHVALSGRNLNVAVKDQESSGSTGNIVWSTSAGSNQTFTGCAFSYVATTGGGGDPDPEPVLRVNELMRDTDTNSLVNATDVEIVVLGGTAGARTIEDQLEVDIVDGVLEVAEFGEVDEEYLIATIESGERMSLLPATVIDASEE